MHSHLFALSLSLLGLAAGCGPACNHDNICAVDGQGASIQVCDGDDFKSCGDGNRGQVVSCRTANRQAVCSNDGWAFENAALP